MNEIFLNSIFGLTKILIKIKKSKKFKLKSTKILKRWEYAFFKAIKLWHSSSGIPL